MFHLKKVFEEVVWYALGRKGNVHKQRNGYLKENKNVTAIQDFLGTLPKNDEHYEKLWLQLVKKK